MFASLLRVASVSCLVGVVAALGACAGGHADAETEGETSAVTATKYYDCWRRFADTDWLKHTEVGLGPSGAEVTDLGPRASLPGTGQLDPSYHPTSSEYAGAIRYNGFQPVIAHLPDTGSMEVIVSPDLQSHAAKGTLWVRTAGPEGGETSIYDCKAKPKKLTVNPTSLARLACNLDVMVCTNDNPPGSSCLSDLFVNQKAPDSATLGLTYLDHFGVHVETRKESLPASGITRTATTVSGAWGDDKLDVTYRAGITYTGNLALANGQTATVSCNDLQMLDP